MQEAEEIERILNTPDKGRQDIYYSKTKSLLAMGLHAAIIIFCLVYSIYKEVYWFLFFGLFSGAIFYKAIKCFIYKKAILVYSNGQLIHTKKNKLYKYNLHQFDREFAYKWNYSQSLSVSDRDGRQLLIENLWYTRKSWEIDEICKKMNLLRLLDKKKQMFAD
jgi:hypothetical protein